MIDHDDVYQLIAGTSAALKKAVRELNPPVKKFPRPVLEIVDSLKDAHDGTTTIQVMKEFIAQYGH